MSNQFKSLIVLVVAGVVAFGMFLIAGSVSDASSTQIQNAIKLASAVIGFGVSVYGGVKALVDLTKPTIDLASVQAASLTGVAGAILLLASQI